MLFQSKHQLVLLYILVLFIQELQLPFLGYDSHEHSQASLLPCSVLSRVNKSLLSSSSTACLSHSTILHSNILHPLFVTMVSTSKQIAELQNEIATINARLETLEKTQARFQEYDDFLGIPSRTDDHPADHDSDKTETTLAPKSTPAPTEATDGDMKAKSEKKEKHRGSEDQQKDTKKQPDDSPSSTLSDLKSRPHKKEKQKRTEGQQKDAAKHQEHNDVAKQSEESPSSIISDSALVSSTAATDTVAEAPTLPPRRDSASSIRSYHGEIDLVSLLRPQRHLAANLRLIQNDVNTIDHYCSEMAGMMHIPDDSGRKWKDSFSARSVELCRMVEGLLKRCERLSSDAEHVNGLEIEYALKKWKKDAGQAALSISRTIEALWTNN